MKYKFHVMQMRLLNKKRTFKAFRNRKNKCKVKKGHEIWKFTRQIFFVRLNFVRKNNYARNLLIYL